jgi:NAD(P)-dependent dehydrogenase (short-subunit alcohol dehydrogenase family)
MEIRLDGRTALITGGSKGLGLATAARFAASGANVAILARDRATLEAAAVQAAKGARGAVEAFPCDVSKLDDIEAVYRAVNARFGTVDILVNNAGAHMSGAFEDITEEMWRQDIDLKFLAAVRLSRLCFPDMKARNWGRILNTLNIFAKAPRARTTPTAVTRAAAMALTKALAAEGAPYNILVNGLVVGVIESDQLRRAYETGGSKGEWKDFLKRAAERSQIPMGRIGRAEEYANVACFLASNAASYVTGCTVNIDGGLSPVL